MIIKCKMCGGDLHPAEKATTCECEFCGTIQTIPKLDNDRRINLYDRANHFRRQNEFDKAAGIYEQILQDDRTDAEAYWSLVLCRYGIEYVEDPSTGKRVPTVNRTQMRSIYTDEDYKSALEYADANQKNIYEQEAAVIDDIHKSILDISKNEEPFDVFICYKETDAEGNRTPDSVLANDLYYQLTREGFKVFFSRITLEDKLGQQYEPYIFAALNSAKVMVVLGTKPEYFNAPWVKNEWSRYLTLIRTGANKTLVPAYKDMDPYDLPDEFSHLQAQDMSKLGFMQDLIYGIKKLTSSDKPVVQQPIIVQQGSTSAGSSAALIDRAFMALEDGEWDKADEFCEKALNLEARNARAYVGKLMAERKVRKIDDLVSENQPLSLSGNYSKALRFADEELKTKLEEYSNAVTIRLEQQRLQNEINSLMASLNKVNTVSEVRAIKASLQKMTNCTDAEAGIKRCEQKIEQINNKAYEEANQLAATGEYDLAAAAFRTLGDYRDSQTAARKYEKLAAERRKLLAAEEAEKAAYEKAILEEKERLAAEQKKQEEIIKKRKEAARAEKKKRIAIIVGIAGIFCVIAFFLITKVIMPANTYNQALSLMQNGEYNEALSMLRNLGTYKDSTDLAQQALANLAYDRGELDAAIEIYSTLPLKYQNHAEDYVALYNNAEALLTEARYDEARDAFVRLGQYEDSSEKALEAMYLKAGSMSENGNREEAIELYISLNGYKDSAVRVAQLQADSWYDSGEYAEAWNIYRTLEEKYQTHKKDFEEKYLYAKELLAKGNYDEASSVFAELGTYEDAKTQVSECTYQKAHSLSKRGNYDAAAALFSGLGDYLDSKNCLKQTEADKLYKEGRYAEAYIIYQELDEAYFTFAKEYEMLYAQSLAMQEEGRYDEAIEAFAALGKYSDSETQVLQAKYLKAGAYATAEKYDEAAEIYSSLDYRDSRELETKTRADKLYSSGDLAGAYELYRKLGNEYQTHTEEYRSAYERAEKFLNSGDYDSAYDSFIILGDYSDAKEKAIQCGRGKANTLFEAGNYGEAAEVYSYIGDQEKERFAKYKYAEQLADQEEYRQAAEQYITIMDYEDSREKHYQMGLMAQMKGELEDAYSILSEDLEYRDTKEIIYQIGLSASQEEDYEVSVPAFTLIGAYKNAAMKLTMDTYSWGGQLYDKGEYDKSEKVFASMGDFSDAPNRAQMAAYAAAETALNHKEYEEAVRRFEKLGDYNDSADRIKEAQYAAAEEKLKAGDYKEAKEQFIVLKDFKNSSDKAKECDYRLAMILFDAGQYTDAKAAFLSLGYYSDSADKAKECDYIRARALFDAEDWADAVKTFRDFNLQGYRDVDTLLNECCLQLATIQIDKEKYDIALTWLEQAKGYKNCDELAEECNRRIALNNAQAFEKSAEYQSAYSEYEKAKESEKAQEMAYQAAMKYMSENDYENAANWFEKADDYNDAREQILFIGEYYYATQQYDLAESTYVKVNEMSIAMQRLYELGQYYEIAGNSERARQAYYEAGNYKDSEEKAKMMTWQMAETLFASGNYEKAKELYQSIPDFKDAESRIDDCDNAMSEIMTHEEYMAAEMDSEVVIESYVQDHQAWWDNKVTVYLQSPDGAYFAYEMVCSEEDAAKLVKGQKIRVKGYKTEWSGEVEIASGCTFEFVEGDSFIAEAEDVTALLASEDLIKHVNEFVAVKGATIVAQESGEAFSYKNSEEKNDDLYFAVEVNGATYNFCVEKYLRDESTDVYKAVEGLKVGDVVDLEGFLYWYNGANLQVTSLTMK